MSGRLSHRITSYNVLSSCLADPSYFTECNPAYLDKNYRLKKVIEKLSREIELKAIINLQEVSDEWAGRLSAFFAQRDYHFFTALYGKKYNGFMGVGIAVPLDVYQILDVDICTIASNLYLPKEQKSNFISKLYEKCFGATPCYWKAALERNNRMISVVLQTRDEAKTKVQSTTSTFSVSCYHMPCAFENPPLMVIHSTLAAQRAQYVARNAGSIPYIIAGDFNFKPNSTMYRLLTEGSLNEVGNPELPVPVAGLRRWKSSVIPLRSAYFVHSSEAKNGKPAKEPDFTNYAKPRNCDVFIDTLDYIFLSDKWVVESVEELPHRDEVAGPLPIETEPSDHILIAATVAIN